MGTRVAVAVSRREASRSAQPAGQAKGPGLEHTGCCDRSFERGLPLSARSPTSHTGPGWAHTARAGPGFILGFHWEAKSQSIIER